MGRGLHPERWGWVTFVWPEKPFRAVSDVHPVTYFPTRSRVRATAYPYRYRGRVWEKGKGVKWG